MGQTLPERGIIFFWFSGDGRCLEILQITSTLRLRRSRTGARKTQFHGLKLTLGRVLPCINVLAAKFWNWNMFVNPRTFFLLDEGASYILHCNRRKVWFWWLWSKYCTTHYALFLSFIRRKNERQRWVWHHQGVRSPAIQSIIICYTFQTKHSVVEADRWRTKVAPPQLEVHGAKTGGGGIKLRLWKFLLCKNCSRSTRRVFKKLKRNSKALAHVLHLSEFFRPA